MVTAVTVVSDVILTERQDRQLAVPLGAPRADRVDEGPRSVLA